MLIGTHLTVVIMLKTIPKSTGPAVGLVQERLMAWSRLDTDGRQAPLPAMHFYGGTEALYKTFKMPDFELVP